MPSITVKSLSETLDLHEIERDARAKWSVDQRSRRRIEETIIRLLPLGLILMVVIFYGLSAGHTSDIVSRMSPTIQTPFGPFNMGSISPLGWELGVLIMAALIAAGWQSLLTHAILYTLLVLACFINVAGAFLSVIATGMAATGTRLQLDQYTVTELLGMHDQLPATFQIVLLLVVPVGIVIPIIAKLAGEGLVKLALGKIKITPMSDDERWGQDSNRVMYAALFTAALNAGATPKTAGNWAETMTGQFYRVRAAPEPLTSAPPLPLPPAVPTPVTGFASLLGQRDAVGTRPIVPSPSQAVPLSQAVPTPAIGTPAQNSAGTSPNVPTLSQESVMAWLQANPDADKLSNRDACRAYMRSVHGLDTDAGYKTVERARRVLRG